MLTGRAVKQIDIPHEPGEWLRIRMLPGRKLEEAQEANSRLRIGYVREMGADILQALRGESRPAPEDAAAEPDLLDGWHVDTLVRAGIVGWSYEDKLTQQAIDDLDGQTRVWAAGEILSYSRPSEVQRKND